MRYPDDPAKQAVVDRASELYKRPQPTEIVELIAELVAAYIVKHEQERDSRLGEAADRIKQLMDAKQPTLHLKKSA